MVQSRALRVGHIIKVDCDSEFPADVVLLQVCGAFCCALAVPCIFRALFSVFTVRSLADAPLQSSNADGCCFVQTTNMYACDTLATSTHAPFEPLTATPNSPPNTQR